MINKKIAELKNGGRVYLAKGQYDITESVVIDTPCGITVQTPTVFLSLNTVQS